MSDRLKASDALPAEVEAYIRKAAAPVKPRSRRAEVERELRSHALDLLDELNGLPPDAAAAEVSRRLGDAMKLSDLLAEANRPPWQRLVLRTSTAALGLAVLAAGTGLIYFQLKLDRAEEKFVGDLEAKFPVFVRAQELWKTDPFFAVRNGQRDAGELLNDKFQWEAGESDPLKIPDDLRSRLDKAFEEGGLRAQMAIDLSATDLDWMSRLKDCDFWDYYRVGKGGQKLKEALERHALIPAGPNMMKTLVIAEARFTKGLQSGRVREALAEIDELARLLTTTETLLGFQIGVHLHYRLLPLWEERALKAELLRDRPRYGGMDTGAARLGGHLYAHALMSYVTPVRYLKEILDHPEWRAGRCTAIAEMLFVQKPAEPYLAPKPWPLERDFGEAVDLRRKVLERAGDCRLTWMRAGGLASASHQPFSFFWSEPPPWLVGALADLTGLLPYGRRMIGLSISMAFWTIP